MLHTQLEANDHEDSLNLIYFLCSNGENIKSSICYLFIIFNCSFVIIYTHTCDIIDWFNGKKIQNVKRVVVTSACCLMHFILNYPIRIQSSEFQTTLTEDALKMRNKTTISNASEHDKHRGEYCMKRFNEFQLLFLKSLPTINTVSFTF